MANFVIVRIGIPYPTEAEAEIIMDISNGETEPIGGPIIPPKRNPVSGVISMVSSGLSAKEISNRFQELSTEGNEDIDMDEWEVFPVMVFEISDDTFAYSKDMGRYLAYDTMFKDRFKIEDSSVKVNKKYDFSLNDILDIMNEKGGYENLNKEEKKILDSFKSS
jgi:hypothetical protein